MIAELTAEQQARFPEFVEKWTRIGLCTDPANRPAAEEGVRLAYRIVGLEPPKKIVWCGSPLSMGLTRHIAQNPTSDKHLSSLIQDSVQVSVEVSVRESVRYLVLLSVSPVNVLVGNPARNSIWLARSIGRSIGFSVAEPVAEPVGFSVWNAVGDAVGDFVSNSVRSWVEPAWLEQFSVQDALRSSVGDAIRGQHNAGWYVNYDYYRDVCGQSELTEKMLGLMQVAENAGWWLPHREICWISERPNRLIRDDRGRCHCEDGPALTYPDGWAVYAIHGVPVDEHVVMNPRSQSLDVIRNEPNAEVKRVRIERFGWGEYLRAVGAVVLDTRHNDVEATIEALMRTPDRQVVLVCSCPSTARVYCLEVPPGIMTCAGAQDWLSGGLWRRVINGA